MKNSQDHSTSTSTSTSTNTWAEALRRPWTALAAAAAVVLGPAAVTASALDQANAAPQHHANTLKAEQTQAYLPTDTTRRRAA